MVILFYEVVTVSLTSMPRMLKLWKKIKEANLPPRVVIDLVMEIQIKTINYRLPYLKRLFNKFGWLHP